MDGSLISLGGARRDGPGVSLMAWSAIVAGVYGLLAVVALTLGQQPGKPAALWYGDAAAVILLLARPRSDRPLLLAAIGAVDLAARLLAVQLQGGSGGVGAWFAPGLVLADLSAIALAAHWLQRPSLPGRAITRAGELLRSLLLGGLAPAMLGGLMAWLMTALVVRLAGGDPAAASAVGAAGMGSAVGGGVSTFGQWLAWVELHLVGSAMLLPLGLLLLARGWHSAATALWRRERIALVALVLLLALWAPTALQFPFFYLLIVLMVAAAIGKFSTAAVSVTLCSVVLCGLITSGLFRPPVAATQLAGVLLFAPRIIDTLAPGAVLLYLPLLLTLVPPLLLATMLERIDAQVAVLAEREASFRDIYQKTPVMMHSVDPQRRLLDVNEEWLSRLGYTRAEVIGRPSTDFLTPESRRRAEEEVIPRFMREGRLRDMDYQLLTKGGETVDVLLSAIWETDAAGQPLRTLSVFKDVTEQKRLAAELAAEKARIESTLQSMSHLAHHDALTGLPNRVLFEDRVHQACQFGHRHQQRFAVVFMDLDHFKRVNDSLGHAAGDALLKLVAQRLTTTLRGSDTVCRLGGDEFVMLLSEVAGADGAVEVSQKILREVGAPCVLEGTELAIGLSLGLAMFPDDGDGPAALMKHADAAMYRAKREGRNRCCVYSKAIDSAEGGRLALPADLHEPVI